MYQHMAGMNPFNAAALLGVKGLICLGLILFGGAVAIIVRKMWKDSL